MSLLSRRRTTTPVSVAPTGRACWICSNGSGPACRSCNRKIRDTATAQGRLYETPIEND